MTGGEFKNLNQFYDGEDDAWEDSSKNILDRAGTAFERYTDSELLASGGMKDVYKVYDSQNRRYVALAKLRADVPEEQCEDFFKEAYLTSSLEHPNIISLYDIGVDSEGTPFFTMELKVGDSLGEILRQRSKGNEEYLNQYPLQKLLEIFIKVCDAISYAHSVDILHLDLKPDNIQVGAFGEVQVCDWGLGSNIRDASSASEIKLVKGTPGFMPPEQIKNDAAKDFTTDIYALGALLYTLITDCGPMSGGIETVLVKTLDGEIISPRERYPDKNIPASLDAVVGKAMSFRKEERYVSVEKLKNEVEKYLSGHSTSAENAGFLKELQLFYKRNRSICHVAIVALGIILTGSSLFVVKIQQSREELRAANKRVGKALKESNKNYELYKLTVAAEQKLTDDLLDMAFKDSLLKLKAPLFYSGPVSQVDEALKTFNKHYKVKGKKSIVRHIVTALIISQKFQKVEEYRNRGANPALVELAVKFHDIQRGRKGEMLDEDFMRFLKEINKLGKETREGLMERVVAYQLDKSNRVFIKPIMLVEVLKCWNQDWNEKKFSYHHKNLFLKIYGENLKVLKGEANTNSELSFLRFIKANHLDIKGTRVSDLRQLNGFSVKVLDLRHTDIVSLKQVRGMKNLNKLIVKNGQFNEKEIGRLPPSVRLEKN